MLTQYLHNKHTKTQVKQQVELFVQTVTLAQKPVEIEVPQAVLPDTVFETVVSIPVMT